MCTRGQSTKLYSQGSIIIPAITLWHFNCLPPWHFLTSSARSGTKLARPREPPRKAPLHHHHYDHIPADSCSADLPVAVLLWGTANTSPPQQTPIGPQLGPKRAQNCYASHNGPGCPICTPTPLSRYLQTVARSRSPIASVATASTSHAGGLVAALLQSSVQ
ncbi:uncharacterized protein CANTADRAFT_25810 [Suhomyces tanzawaensis NRRL Y-17324]|uniref:Uncharacterized protein n=1 Tax=Suhomyces tanzawaensis NRRL Y-17324 TaxID=984487 RepID=A0A1E4SKQ3_9ASCO|nr:uncharacterized protein CANTADRAFT_25810 [Suhomyces tanzawaensis NRRL Y-17324]ODV80084.1 hypothetical protein CANTADRAFT_25810 [Suhomyces tanzawaensis NRRL Y-17324]